MDRPSLERLSMLMMGFLEEALDLPPCRLTFHFSTRKTVAETSNNSAAYVELNHPYVKATLVIAEDFDTPEELFDTLLHEALHLKLAPIDQFKVAWEHRVKGRDMELYHHLFTTADEQVTVGLERALSPILWELYEERHGLDERGMDDAGDVSEQAGEFTVN